VQNSHAKPVEENLVEKPTGVEEVNAKEIVALTKSKKSVSSMEFRWHSAMKMFGKEYQAPLSVKEKSQLKRLGLLLGDQKFQVLDWCLENWLKFAGPASAEAGLNSYPQTPNVGFLLKYHAYAVNKLQSIAKTANTVDKYADPVITSSYTPPIVSEEDKPYVPSDEEFAKIMADLEAIT
jgi:hypothetical protein